LHLYKKFLLNLGTSDFFGLNHYSTELAEYGIYDGGTTYDKDQDVFKTQDPSWPPSAASWLKVYIETTCFKFKKLKKISLFLGSSLGIQKNCKLDQK